MQLHMRAQRQVRVRRRKDVQKHIKALWAHGTAGAWAEACVMRAAARRTREGSL